MNFEPAGPLRTSTNLGDNAATIAADQGVPGEFDTFADLVADLVAAADIVPRDRLAAARGRAGAGSLAEALRDDGSRETRTVSHDRSPGATTCRSSISRRSGCRPTRPSSYRC